MRWTTFYVCSTFWQIYEKIYKNKVWGYNVDRKKKEKYFSIR
jgi:hypothetical protein